MSEAKLTVNTWMQTDSNLQGGNAGGIQHGNQGGNQGGKVSKNAAMGKARTTSHRAMQQVFKSQDNTKGNRIKAAGLSNDAINRVKQVSPTKPNGRFPHKTWDDEFRPVFMNRMPEVFPGAPKTIFFKRYTAPDEMMIGRGEMDDKWTGAQPKKHVRKPISPRTYLTDELKPPPRPSVRKLLNDLDDKEKKWALFPD